MARLQKAAQNAALAAKELGQYQLEEKLGEGGMGVVYRGRHRMLRRPTAIKLLHPDKTTDEAIARFEREVQLTCQLNHPNTIAIYDYGRTPEGHLLSTRWSISTASTSTRSSRGSGRSRRAA